MATCEGGRKTNAKATLRFWTSPQGYQIAINVDQKYTIAGFSYLSYASSPRKSHSQPHSLRIVNKKKHTFFDYPRIHF